MDYGTGIGFSYDLALPLATDGPSTRALSPAIEVCRVPLRRGGGATYLPIETRPGISVETSLRTGSMGTDANESTTPQRTRSPDTSE